jgi:hypothetical protein
MLFVTSGSHVGGGIPGNVLLAFSVDGRCPYTQCLVKIYTPAISSAGSSATCLTEQKSSSCMRNTT